MTESEKAKIVALWENGMSLTQIRQLMPYTTRQFKATVAEMKANGEFPKERQVGKDKVAEAVRNGEENPYVLAEMFGISVRSAKEYKRIYGGVSPKKRPKRNYRHCPRTVAITEDLKDGNLTVAQIARKHGVTWSYVNTIRKRLREDSDNEPNRT